MNKLLSNAIFYGSAMLLGGTLGSFVGLSQSNIPDQIQDLEIQIEEPEVEESPKATPIATEKDEKKDKVVAESVVATPTISKMETVQEKPVPSKVPTTEATSTIIETYEDYEKTILGTCPSQRDKTNRWERGNRLNAINIITSGDSKTSPMMSMNALIEGWWNDYMLGKWTGKHLMAPLNQMPEFDNTYANSRVGMFIDFDGLFVTWDNTWEEGKTADLNTQMMLNLDHMASEGTNYLRWLDSTYRTKCPND